MLRFRFIALFLLVKLISYINCSVYEALDSEDVDFFVEYNPDEKGALMFYDDEQEAGDPELGGNVKKVIGIFLNIGEEGRSTDDWINQLQDKAHMLRIDVGDADNKDAVTKYNVTTTPYLVLLDDGKSICEEVVTNTTYDSVKK